jgi:diaminohydroxyphosphoribosylaminopyrimidine deaminase/5-amino-6-(5-phosphoribosylamino)uracil reductase
MDQHEIWMQRALALARQAEGFTSPNPMVGAVIVKEGRVVGEGYHRRAGLPHAEVEALRAAGETARGGTMYVTLEPCNHYGRTPPCTEAIIKAGIAELYYAVADPNPRVEGGGHARLAAANIAVYQGPGQAEARRLNRFFFHHITTGRPYVIAKFAASLDGKIATRTGHSRWITTPAAREKGHTLRQAVDAILIGAETAIADNPQLTTRLPRTDLRHPLRLMLDSRGRVPLDRRLFQPGLPGRTVVVTTPAMSPAHQAALCQQGVEVLALPATPTGRVDLAALLLELGQRRLVSLLVEGGGQMLGAFFEAGLVNEVWAFLAPLIIGGQAAPGPVAGAGFATLTEACRLKEATVETIDSDFLIRGVV